MDLEVCILNTSLGDAKNLWAWPNSAFPGPSVSKVLSVDKVLGTSWPVVAWTQTWLFSTLLHTTGWADPFSLLSNRCFLQRLGENSGAYVRCSRWPAVKCGDQRGLVGSFWSLRMLLLVWVTPLSFGPLQEQDGAGVNLLPSELQGVWSQDNFYLARYCQGFKQ